MKKFFYLLSLFLFVSCSEEKEVIPDHIIQPNKMSDVLLDVQLMKSHLSQERIIDPYILDSVNAFYNAVYQRYDITKADFDSSLSYYSNHIIMLDSIYDKVFADLKKMELELKNVKYNAPNIKYLTREKLISTLQTLRFSDYLLQDSITFISARDSLNGFIKHHISELDTLKIMPVQLKNSFAVYANSNKRMEQLKRDLR